jgi:hypothetical protein
LPDIFPFLAGRDKLIHGRENEWQRRSSVPSSTDDSLYLTSS